MDRHENIVCNGCGQLEFTGRCYRCLSCEDFNLCAECYEEDFTTTQHPFDHPVKCIYTQADIELYFGGEYLNDPPQSYRCPYCKQWGFNESTFLEHISEQHDGASTLLVSTILTQFEQHRAVRLFLEDEQLAVFSSAAKSRNELMSRNVGSLELYLEPLNRNGSYRNRKVQKFHSDAQIAANSNNNQNVDNNNHREPVERPREQRQHFLHQMQTMDQLASSSSTDTILLSEPLSTSRTNRSANVRVLPNHSPNPSSSGRHVNPFAANRGAARTRLQRQNTPRIQVEGRPASAGRMTVERLRERHADEPLENVVHRIHELTDQLDQRIRSGFMLRTITEQEEEPEPMQMDQQQQTVSEIKPQEKEDGRFLCTRFLTTSAALSCPSEEHLQFVAQRAEFVAQLFASVLCVEELETPPAEEVEPPQVRKRSCGNGAGDSEVDLKRNKQF